MFNYNIMDKIILISLICFLLLIIIILIVLNKRNKESFDNLESNLYTYDTCCKEDEIQKCQTYGKTGVCNYNLNDKSCSCQSAY